MQHESTKTICRLIASGFLPAICAGARRRGLGVTLLFLLGLVAGACDGSRSGRSGPPTNGSLGDSTKTLVDPNLSDYGPTNKLDIYDMMLSRYRIDNDSAFWCFPPIAAKDSLRRAVDVRLDLADVMPLVSLEAAPIRDSASVAAILTRLVAALPTDSTSPLFGVPFTVRRAYQGSGGGDPGGRVERLNYMIAVLVRRLPQEDRQLEEQFAVIAQQPAAPATGPWQLVWHERSQGTEDELTMTDPWLMLRIRATGQPAVVFVKESAAGNRLVLVERATGGVWRARRERGIVPCSSVY